MQDEDLVCAAEAARIVGVTKKTVIDWIRAGMVPSTKFAHLHCVSIEDVKKADEWSRSNSFQRQTKLRAAAAKG